MVLVHVVVVTITASTDRTDVRPISVITKCVNTLELLFVFAVSDFISDCFIIVLPIPMVSLCHDGRDGKLMGSDFAPAFTDGKEAGHAVCVLAWYTVSFISLKDFDQEADSVQCHCRVLDPHDLGDLGAHCWL